MKRKKKPRLAKPDGRVRSGARVRGHVHRDQVEIRLQEVARLRRAGYTQDQIAEKLQKVGIQVSRSQIRDDCQLLRKQWRENASLDYDDLMSEQVEHFETVRREAWRMFQTTKDDRQKERMLDLVRRTTYDLSKVLGLDDPVAFTARKVSGEEGSMTNLRIVELTVHSREDLADITEPDGTIDLNAFKERIAEDARKGT